MDVAAEAEALRLRGVRVDADVERIGADAEREEGLGIGPAARAVAHTRRVPGEIVREIPRRRYARRRVHVVAMIHRPNRLSRQRRERFVQVLAVAPRREGRVLAQRTLRHRLLRADGTLRIDDGECGEADAREEHRQGNAKAE